MVASATKKKHPKQVFVILEVGPKRKQIQFKVDTGAQVNVLPSKYVDQMKGSHLYCPHNTNSMAMEAKH